MSRLSQYIGRRVSHVVALDVTPKYRIVCQCDCGNICNVQGQTFEKAMKESRGLSCGCMKKRLIAIGQTHHGMTYSPEWKSWMSMKDRCLDPSHKSYADYGGRGITIFSPWVTSFEEFFKEMGPRPAGTTLGRIKNDLGYQPGNCAWHTHKEQSRNKRNSVFIEHDGLTLNLAEWAERLGMGHDTLTLRIKAWGVHEAITRPLKRQKNSRTLTPTPFSCAQSPSG